MYIYIYIYINKTYYVVFLYVMYMYIYIYIYTHTYIHAYIYSWRWLACPYRRQALYGAVTIISPTILSENTLTFKRQFEFHPSGKIVFNLNVLCIKEHVFV